MMTRNRATIAMGAIVCLSWAIAPSAIATNPNQQYSPGRLTQIQSNVLTRHELAWPQSYGAITSKLGYPNDSDQDADYYTLSDGRKVTIGYAGGYAVYGAVEGI